ncbi:hypothetical protein ATM17_12685 [Sphingopyxis macrogoltabida]|uniref:Uncharacterized protein n=1 Tax=Sphingopyxis macrogoltabida TaxID=33050 RepID=A0AAC8Z183_SPHMC|nr:hypothetical protein LH19_07150 [Sphingopyxis macrogoltabida]AMU89892.1 hypothetical protein ATM17_12685 [Sphingopyxis macrogoltabida]
MGRHEMSVGEPIIQQATEKLYVPAQILISHLPKKFTVLWRDIEGSRPIARTVSLQYSGTDVRSAPIK